MIIVKNSQAILLDKNQLHTKINYTVLVSLPILYRVHSLLPVVVYIGNIVNIWKSVWSEHPLLEQPSFVC